MIAVDTNLLIYARIAGKCIDYDVQELWTADHDFSRFDQIKP